MFLFVLLSKILLDKQRLPTKDSPLPRRMCVAAHATFSLIINFIKVFQRRCLAASLLTDIDWRSMRRAVDYTETANEVVPDQ